MTLAQSEILEFWFGGDPSQYRKQWFEKDPEFDVSDWWEHKGGLERFLKELAGMCYAKWTLRHTEPTTGTILEIPYVHRFIGDMLFGLH